ncbi:MAG TPA: UDP-3-O-acyl-N-acetylglucosamine deacetylase, partial [Vicinamibacteria bacterium]|nr:UDP-3-O-acyl-N-acetylglucosamine deacetylase [Vicinamibacteria bacterium]
VLNNPLRFPDEFVRHKILDLLGDLVLLGKPLRAHVVALRAGHALHTRLVKTILESTELRDTAARPIEELVAAEVSAPALARSASAGAP